MLELKYSTLSCINNSVCFYIKSAAHALKFLIRQKNKSNKLNPLGTNPNSRRIVLVCLTNFWGWQLKC